jgi:hypothetical protein
VRLRKLLIELSKELNISCPPQRSRDMVEWRDQIECLMDQILWDRDFDEDFIEPDDPPDVAEAV